MSAATASPPIIPPRPSRSQDKASVPMVPPRPTNRRIQRSISPNPDRFAPSPLNEAVFLKSPNQQASSLNGHSGDPIPRSTSVDLPSLGEEGKEYASLADELNSSNEGSTSPEQTRTVAHDLKLHAPKPSLPAASAKQRVMTVTRTDSERAASFGIGRPSSADNSTAVQPSNRSLKKKASTASQLSTTAESHHDDEHGIPEIGLQVPMYKNAGDVQAPSPAPSSAEGQKPKHHTRRTSARGNLPPGSYGLHGHGVAPQDKLEKAYYDKHPDLLKKEHVPHHYDRPNDFSMSSDDLNKIVKDTASRGSGLGVKNYSGTPSDQIGWQALEETASRIASPGNASPELKEAPIHVEEPNRRRSVMFSDSESVKTAEEEVERPYTAPILAEDELAKDPSAYAHEPAVEPHTYDSEGPASRPASRPTSLYRETSYEVRSTPLEDVEEYEPLFKDDEKQQQEEEKKKLAKEDKAKKQRFPSADIWEDAPSSVYYTAEVSTPELFDGREQDKPSPAVLAPPRDGETPAQAFARQQEELAEKEARGQKTEGFVPAPDSKKPLWAQHQKHLATESAAAARPTMGQRFPSRDVWEDAPDSLNLETTVSTPQQDEEDAASAAATTASPVDTSKPAIPSRPQPKTDAPAIPDRPRPRQASGDDKPAVPERPKPAIPARPVKASPTSGGLEPAEAAAPPRQKPAVPVRPAGGVGSKIAALQAGFMSDLNRRLQLGPQGVLREKKKEEEEAEEEKGGEGGKKEEEKEKVPLSDARKGRARGPARRAPAAAAAAAASPTPAESAAAAAAKPVFAFAAPVTLFEIDPEEGTLSAASSGAGEVQHEAEGEKKAEVEPEPAPEAPEPAPAAADVSAPAAEAVTETETEQQEAEGSGEKKEEAKEEAPAQEAEPAAAAAASSASAAETTYETETKSLATNMAGETLVKEEVKKDEEQGDVEPVKVVEN